MVREKEVGLDVVWISLVVVLALVLGFSSGGIWFLLGLGLLGWMVGGFFFGLGFLVLGLWFQAFPWLLFVFLAGVLVVGWFLKVFSEGRCII
jgi:hypothetical protein